MNGNLIKNNQNPDFNKVSCVKTFSVFYNFLAILSKKEPGYFSSIVFSKII